jgi:preprotein translocase subunit YajC
MSYLLLDVNVDNNPIINGLQKTTSQTNVGATKNFNNSIASSIFVYLILFIAAYYFLIRPNKKQRQKIENFQNSLKPGDDIITSSGFHGKVIEINDDARTVVVEFGVNKTIRVTIEKSQILSTSQDRIEGIGDDKVTN